MKSIAIAILALTFTTAFAQQNNPPEINRARQQLDETRQRAQDARQRAIDTARQAHIEFEMMLEGQPDAAGREQVTHLGVSTVEVMPALSEQLGLPRGWGLVADFVEPGSPAQVAGIRQYDVLMKMDDQRLANPEQLRTLLQLMKPGDEIKLSIIRQARPMELTARLTRKDLDIRRTPVRVPGHGGLVRPTVPEEPAPGQPAPQVIQQTDVVGGGGAVVVTDVQGAGQITVADDKMTLIVKRTNGKTVSIVARDRQGKIFFEGPVQTPEQRQTLPPDVARKLEEIERIQVRTLQDVPAAAPVKVPFHGLVMQHRGGSRVLVSQTRDMLLLARFETGKPAYALAVSTTTGRTLFDGPIVTEAQRQSMPDDVARQIDVLEKNQHAASEFGIVR